MASPSSPGEAILGQRSEDGGRPSSLFHLMSCHSSRQGKGDGRIQDFTPAKKALEKIDRNVHQNRIVSFWITFSSEENSIIESIKISMNDM